MNKDLLKKIKSHVSMSLKSFNMTISDYNNEILLGHLKGVLNDKIYIFYIVESFKKEEVETSQFNQSLNWCQVNGYNFVVIARSWDTSLSQFEGNDCNWKIISLNTVSELGQKYLEACVVEKENRKMA